MRDIDRKFSGAIDQLVQSYDEHMKKILPKPKLLPIRVNISVPSKMGMRIENAHVKPYDSVGDVFKIIEEYQNNRGDSVLEWKKDQIKVKITGPLHDEKGDDEEGKKEDQEMIDTSKVVEGARYGESKSLT